MAILLAILLSSNRVFSASPKCELDWINMMQAESDSQRHHEYWLMRQYSGTKVNDIGNYEECNKLSNAKYTTFGFSAVPVITFNFCGPESCSKSDYYETPLPYLNITPPYVEFSKQYQDENYESFDSGALAMLTFTIAILVIIFFSTLSEYLIRGERRNSIIFKIILCFSLKNNVKKLLTGRSQEKLGEKDSLDILNCVRVLSISWVIYGHTYFVYSYAVPLLNYETYYKGIEEFKYILVYTGFFAVDTFLWMSGLLMSYLFLNEFEKNPASLKKIILLYAWRVFRITPVYMFCLFFFWSLMPYMGSGPFWFNITDFYNDDCHKYWYSNLLYINNFVPDWKASSCLGQSWFLAVDMQLFLISPVILLLYINISQKAVWILLFVLNLAGVLIAGIISNHYNLNPSILSSDNQSNYFNYYYTKPYCRIPPYAIGLACGMIVYSYREFKKTGRVFDSFAVAVAESLKNKLVRFGCLAAGLGTINFLIFIQYDLYKEPGEEFRFHRWSSGVRYGFIALERAFFGMGLSMCLVPIILGYFRKIREIMSAYFWNILARLCFVVFLAHYGLITVSLKNIKKNTTFEYGSIFKDSVYFLVLSFVCAVPIVLGVEFPALNLGKLFLVSQKKIEEIELNIKDSSAIEENVNSVKEMRFN